MPRSSKWSLSLSFLHQNHLCTPPFSHTCYMPFPSHSPKQYFLSSTVHKATHNVVFSTPLSPCPSMAWVSSSAPYSHTCLVCVLTSMWQIKCNLVSHRTVHSYLTSIWSVHVLLLLESFMKCILSKCNFMCFKPLFHVACSLLKQF